MKRKHSAQSSGGTLRTLLLITMAVIVIYLMMGIGGVLQSKMMKGNFEAFHRFALGISSKIMTTMIDMEMPDGKSEDKDATNHWNGAFIHWIAGLDVSDPNSLLSEEIPGFAQVNMQAQTSSADTGFSKDSAALLSKSASPGSRTPGQSSILRTEDRSAADSTASSDEQSKSQSQQSQTDSSKQESAARLAFVYQTHSTESFLPELPGVTLPKDAYSKKINITNVGAHLAADLRNKGIDALHSDIVYPDTVKNFQYIYSYKYSLSTIQQAMSRHTGLEYLFDIHRDSEAREITTETYHGKTYAKVYFIIGGKNPNWQANEKLAKQVSGTLDAIMPGISRGVLNKKKNGNAEYNQFVSPDSILIEIGGPYNTLEEEYRSADVLASALAEVMLKAKTAQATPASGAAAQGKEEFSPPSGTPK